MINNQFKIGPRKLCAKSYRSHFDGTVSGVLVSLNRKRSWDGSSSSGVGGNRVGPIASTKTGNQALVQRLSDTLPVHWIHLLAHCNIVADIAASTTDNTTRYPRIEFRSVFTRNIRNKAREFHEKKWKRCSRKNKDAGGTRVMRFTLDWKTVARNVKPKIEWSVAQPQGRPSRYGTRGRRPPSPPNNAIRFTTYAHLYLHPSMKYSHPTHDLFTSGRSRARINIK